MKHNYLRKNFLIFTLLLLISGKSFAQSNYSITSIPYQVYTAQLDVQGTSDDHYSPVIPLTFDFDFFGNIYNEVVVGTNGVINFDIVNAVDYCPWQFDATIPDASFQVKNAVLGCYHDMNNDNGQGTITSAIVGNAPYRKFIVIFNNNSHFTNSPDCLNTKTSMQMILYETLNFIDVQLIDKQVCPSWNGGRAVTGIINETGLIAFTPPGRNTGQWTAFHEGWRFSRPINNVYSFSKCDTGTFDGFTNFNLQTVEDDLSPPGNPNAMTFYTTLSDAQNGANPIADLNFTNTIVNTQTIYAVGNGLIVTVVLTAVDCSEDADADSVSNGDEDVNGDGNLFNDDTDSDGIPNFLDNDDDGDLVLTNEEYVFSDRNANGINAVLDTDGDGIFNYLDNDDDGDGTLTINEDYNGNNDPTDDDTNANSIPDYLDSAVHLKVTRFQLENGIRIYPNPANDVLHVDNKTDEAVSEINVYSINGILVKNIKDIQKLSQIPVSDLQSGLYFVKIQVGGQLLNYKFIKK